MKISLLLALLAGLIAAFAQILLKISANEKHKNIFYEFFNFKVIFGYALLLLTTFLNVLAYKILPLRFQPMIDSTSIVWVMILSVIVLKERISRKKIWSLLLIGFGICIYCI